MGLITSFILPKSLTAFFQQKFERWLSKRIPSKSSHQLNNKNIMIYPSRFGLGYIGFIILLFILGTNYQNNIILLLSYLLGSFFITVMLHSFYNFSQLQFSSDKQQHGYVGEDILFPVYLIANKTHYDINLHFSRLTSTNKVERLTQCQQGTQAVNLVYNNSSRGKFMPGRVTVFSEYSFGLFKSKTVLDFGHQAIVYPKPLTLLAGQYQFSAQPLDNNNESYNTNNAIGTDDFFELRSYVQGESRARIAWKQLAKGQGHYSKHYQESEGKLQWLALKDMPSNNLEIQLSYLTFLVDELSTTNQVFGLLLPSGRGSEEVHIEPSSGLLHQQACLTALALY